MENILEYSIQTDKYIRVDSFIQFIQSSGVSYIIDHYERIMGYVGPFDSAFEYLYTECDIKFFLKEKIFYNLKTCAYQSRMLEKVLHLYVYDMDEKERNSFFEKNTCQLLEIVPISSLFVLLEYKNMNVLFYNKLATKIRENKRQYLENIFVRYFPYIKKSRYSDVIFSSLILLIDEILEYEKLDYIDIDILQSGSFSGAFQIGSKVFKCSNRRETYSIPYHPRILQPLIRVDLSTLTPGIEKSGFLSVTEFVDTNTPISLEELYQVYKEFRHDGYIWGDVKKENVGILMRANTKYWDRDLGDHLGIVKDESVPEKILDQGEIVVLDDDYIYYENDPDIILIGELTDQFENRYQEERKNTVHL